jgi:hypothetical protein
VQLKIKNDPRVTRVGRVLRKTSLDEIPRCGTCFAAMSGGRDRCRCGMSRFDGEWQQWRYRPSCLTCLWRSQPPSTDHWMELNFNTSTLVLAS